MKATWILMVVGTWIACVTVLSLVTACPYTSATNLKYNSGVIIDKSFHPEVQEGWTTIDGIWYKPIWVSKLPTPKGCGHSSP
jgi:hypothetical protein